MITIALNPSTTEFEPWRLWPKEPLEADALALRLASYFRSVNPRPHPWFGDYQEAIGMIGADYKVNSAHLDLSPWPFLSPTYLAAQNDRSTLLRSYNSALEEGRERWLRRLISCCASKLKVVMILDSFEVRGKQTAAICLGAVPKPWVGQIEVFEGSDQARRWCWDNRDSLRRLVGTNVYLG